MIHYRLITESVKAQILGENKIVQKSQDCRRRTTPDAETPAVSFEAAGV
jgi:hypothetical protein